MIRRGSVFDYSDVDRNGTVGRRRDFEPNGLTFTKDFIAGLGYGPVRYPEAWRAIIGVDESIAENIIEQANGSGRHTGSKARRVREGRAGIESYWKTADR